MGEGDKEGTEGMEEETGVAWEEEEEVAWEEDRAMMTPHRVQIMGERYSYVVH